MLIVINQGADVAFSDANFLVSVRLITQKTQKSAKDGKKKDERRAKVVSVNRWNTEISTKIARTSPSIFDK